MESHTVVVLSHACYLVHEGNDSGMEAMEDTYGITGSFTCQRASFPQRLFKETQPRLGFQPHSELSSLCPGRNVLTGVEVSCPLGSQHWADSVMNLKLSASSYFLYSLISSSVSPANTILREIIAGQKSTSNLQIISQIGWTFFLGGAKNKTSNNCGFQCMQSY